MGAQAKMDDSFVYIYCCAVFYSFFTIHRILNKYTGDCVIDISKTYGELDPMSKFQNRLAKY